jgi:hypothetical protein
LVWSIDIGFTRPPPQDPTEPNRPILFRKVATLDDMAEKNRAQGKSKKAMTKKARLEKKKVKS